MEEGAPKAGPRRFEKQPPYTPKALSFAETQVVLHQSQSFFLSFSSELRIALTKLSLSASQSRICLHARLPGPPGPNLPSHFFSSFLSFLSPLLLFFSGRISVQSLNLFARAQPSQPACQPASQPLSARPARPTLFWPHKNRLSSHRTKKGKRERERESSDQWES